MQRPVEITDEVVARKRADYASCCDWLIVTQAWPNLASRHAAQVRKEKLRKWLTRYSPDWLAAQLT